jgi:hypothetical protein
MGFTRKQREKDYSMQKSIHIEKGFPFIINLAHKVFHKSNVRRFRGFFMEHHLSFFGSSVTFLIIAVHACGNKIFPRIIPPFRFRDNVVDSQCNVPSFAILASVHIAPENIFARENNFFVWNSYKYKKTNNCRIRDFSRNRVNSS